MSKTNEGTNAAPLARGEMILNETESLVETPAGVVAVRVREYEVPCHVGGRGTVWTPRYEVAVRTPRSVRERQAPADGGFVVVEAAWLRPDMTVPDGAAEVHVAVGLDVEAVTAARAASQRAAADRPPARPDRPARPALPPAPAPERRSDDGSGGEGAEGPPTAPPPARTGDRGPVRRADVRRVKPAGDRWESRRRLLCARCAQLERLTGEDAADTRHAAAWAASADRSWVDGRARVSSSTALDDDEMDYAVSWVEHKLAAEGFDFEADQEAYEERCRIRHRMEAERAARLRARAARTGQTSPREAA